MEISVASIIVLFQTPISFIETIPHFLKECDLLILVSNGTTESFNRSLSETYQHNSKLVFIELDKNYGLSYAQNVGIKKGFDYEAKFFLFFDDDSFPSPNFTECLLTNYEKQIGNLPVGIIAPNIKHPSGGNQKYWIQSSFFWRRRSFREEESVLYPINTVIASGSLIPSLVIRQLGMFREDYFIDYIDIEYCLRVRSSGFIIMVVKEAELNHHLGARDKKEILGLEIYPTNHNAIRKFYMTRNRVWTWKLYSFKLPSWFAIDFGNFLFDSFRTILFEQNKIQKTKQLMKGLFFGFFLNPKAIKNT